jgi:hypothetical protein
LAAKVRKLNEKKVLRNEKFTISMEKYSFFIPQPQKNRCPFGAAACII